MSMNTEAIVARDTATLQRATTLAKNQIFIGIFTVSAFMVIAAIAGLISTVMSGTFLGLGLAALVIAHNVVSLTVPTVSEVVTIAAVTVAAILSGLLSGYLAGVAGVGGLIALFVVGYAVASRFIPTVAELIVLALVTTTALLSGVLALTAAVMTVFG